MGYSAFNPTAWLIFIGFCAFTWLVVKVFHTRHPDYPGNQDWENEESKK